MKKFKEQGSAGLMPKAKSGRPPFSNEFKAQVIELVREHYHDWFEGRGEKCCLIVFTHDATSKLVSILFEKSQTMFGYMGCVESHLQAHGRPLAYYCDRHSIFKTTRNEDGLHQDTQFKKALTVLKIELI